MSPDVAVMMLVPMAAAVDRPVLLIVAMLSFNDLQDTRVVRSCMVLSEYVPVAVNCCVAPMTIEVLFGVTAIEMSVF
jgi:hypothetical protein